MLKFKSKHLFILLVFVASIVVTNCRDENNFYTLAPHEEPQVATPEANWDFKVDTTLVEVAPNRDISYFTSKGFTDLHSRARNNFLLSGFGIPYIVYNIASGNIYMYSNNFMQLTLPTSLEYNIPVIINGLEYTKIYYSVSLVGINIKKQY